LKEGGEISSDQQCLVLHGESVEGRRGDGMNRVLLNYRGVSQEAVLQAMIVALIPALGAKLCRQREGYNNVLYLQNLSLRDFCCHMLGHVPKFICWWVSILTS